MSEPAVTTEDADQKVNILIVDDRPDKLMAHEVLLEELNQNIVKATSGKEALRCLLKEDFAVILLDVNMPGMDGFETASMIRQRPRSETTPIIFISAVNDTENHVSRGYSLGAVDYILTPVVPEILRAKIMVFADLFKKTEQIKRQGEERAKFIRAQAARKEAEARQERLAFLADASNVLARSLEFHDTFQNLAHLVVPRLADFCIIDIADDFGMLQQVAVAHRDPEQAAMLENLREHYPSSLASRHGGTRVFQTGKSEMCCDMTEEVLHDLFDREEDRQLIRALNAKSYTAVPLRARDRVLGAITMVNTTAHRQCGPNELSLAEELAQRAALALDNAGLYKAAQKAREEAERANLAKDRFLAMLSHELRTPLTPVLTSLLSFDSEEDVPDKIRPTLQMIRRNVELEARLIDDLLDLTRISKGKVQLSLEIVDAHGLLRNALEICQADIDQKQLVLELDLSASHVRLEADPARVQQIFWNLIKNAVKFTAQGGQLRIRTGNDELASELRVEVSDSGVGIDAESLPKIFKAFEQGERARMGGLGLGLAISKSLVEAHHGHITAESAGRDQGATFTAVFPLTDVAAQEESNGSGAAPADRKTMRILLVEDHEDTNRSLTQLLRRRGYHVQPAHNVRNALDLAATEEFDIVVSDIGLPDGTGVDLMQRLNATRPIAGIALTGFGMEEDIQKSHDGGFYHHLVKPVDLNKLDSIIQKVPLVERS
ncbi:MAG: Signal transduction histidine kinase [uncultured Chthoniobacterales bacterium]|uniref:histidine kinase n=1 Tax=uncultured Chthoniobacterales bacterium TaxID=1836801 RepID=A0A6J4IBF9_9BACT|nr:MAG: Signal transduction histidine kinase [uncultured Chthoniobacterales bacterium]